MPSPERALDRAVPGFVHGPLVGLGTFPTPVQELDLSGVAPSFGGRAWVKREDLTAEICGGNKVRKLELLLGQALAQERDMVLTLGGIGSNHCLATAYHAPEAGLRVHLVIFPHEVTPTSRRTLRAICALGPEITVARSDTTAPLVMGAVAAQLGLRGHRPLLVPPGGSSVTGVLGYVNAGLEIAEQVGAGDLPEPQAVYLPYGSGGSAAGLAVGLQIGGLSTEVLAVRVYPQPATSQVWLRWLASRAHRRIATRHTGLPALDLSRLRAVDGYLGEGYAVPTADASAAREVAADLGLTMEPTYTAKAFAAFLDAAATHRRTDANLLFMHTYDARLPTGLDEDPPRGLVPRRLRRYLD